VITVDVFLVTVNFHFDFHKIRNWFISADCSVGIGACDGSGQFDSGISFLMTVFSLIQVWVQPESIMALTVKLFPLVLVISGLITSSCTPRHF
jgi:hypothetical protein